MAMGRGGGTAPSFRKLSPTQLAELGFSRKAEKYFSHTGNIISKRQYQQARLALRVYVPPGEKLTLEKRAKAYRLGQWKYDAPARERAALAASRSRGWKREISRIARAWRREGAFPPGAHKELKEFIRQRGEGKVMAVFYTDRA